MKAIPGDYEMSIKNSNYLAYITFRLFLHDFTAEKPLCDGGYKY